MHFVREVEIIFSRFSKDLSYKNQNKFKSCDYFFVLLCNPLREQNKATKTLNHDYSKMIFDVL